MRLIDADKLPVIRTFALVNDENTKGGFAFAPIYCVIKGDLDNAPTVEPERPKGNWIIDGHHIRCNRCNEYICNTDREGDKIPDNFCPNCGADMRGGKNEQD